MLDVSVGLDDYTTTITVLLEAR